MNRLALRTVLLMLVLPIASCTGSSGGNGATPRTSSSTGTSVTLTIPVGEWRLSADAVNNVNWLSVDPDRDLIVRVSGQGSSSSFEFSLAECSRIDGGVQTMNPVTFTQVTRELMGCGEDVAKAEEELLFFVTGSELAVSEDGSELSISKDSLSLVLVK